MLKQIFTRRPAQRVAARRTDRRSGAPVRQPEPMPRIRWYS
jgi:hypothetical protein